MELPSKNSYEAEGHIPQEKISAGLQNITYKTTAGDLT
jgi:hypothetical protein